MKCSPLLFSRTVSRDYRWIFSSSLLSRRDVSICDEAFKLYDQHKQSVFSKIGLPAFYCIELSNCFAVFVCHESTRRDQNSRPIHALEGVAVQKEFQRDLVTLLPALLRAPEIRLAMGQWIGVADMEHTASKEITVELELPQDNGFSASDSIAEMTYGRSALPIVLPLSASGLEQMKALVFSYRGCSVPQLAFGTGSVLLPDIDRLAIVSFVNGDLPSEEKLLYRGKFINPIVKDFDERRTESWKPPRTADVQPEGGSSFVAEAPLTRGAGDLYVQPYCEIRIDIKKRVFGGYSVVFVAEARGFKPSKSLPVSDDMQCEDLRFLGLGAECQSPEMVRCLESVTESLLAAGWRLLPGLGSYWWAFRFVQRADQGRVRFPR